LRSGCGMSSSPGRCPSASASLAPPAKLPAPHEEDIRRSPMAVTPAPARCLMRRPTRSSPPPGASAHHDRRSLPATSRATTIAPSPLTFGRRRARCEQRKQRRGGRSPVRLITVATSVLPRGRCRACAVRRLPLCASGSCPGRTAA
jgi:hypothetical protein